MEIIARENDKGDAVQAVLGGCGDGVACAYLGDDITDEAAFQAIRPRGLGVLVGEERRTTHATLWLRPPEEVAAFVELWTRT